MQVAADEAAPVTASDAAFLAAWARVDDLLAVEDGEVTCTCGAVGRAKSFLAALSTACRREGRAFPATEESVALEGSVALLVAGYHFRIRPSGQLDLTGRDSRFDLTDLEAVVLATAPD